jgi:hypothetical protein
MCTQGAIIENTPDMIIWLEENGYTLSKYYSRNGDYIFTCTNSIYGTFNYTPEEIIRYTSKEHVIGGRIDCTGNKTLFIETVDNDYKNNLVIKKIEPPTAELWRNNGEDVEYIGTFNEYELLDVRAQIKEKKLKGYFIVFYDENNKKHKIKISSHNGELSDYPNGLFSKQTDCLMRLI